MKYFCTYTFTYRFGSCVVCVRYLEWLRKTSLILQDSVPWQKVGAKVSVCCVRWSFPPMRLEIHSKAEPIPKISNGNLP